ncbi:MAG: Hsp70 family protein [Melioribacteraceae bacterium]|nr:Hsp70 family protein [Melioribacteraceae bacterium]
MENMINYGIDLGTTNSVIAKYVKGDVEIFKNFTTWKDTLPSVVGFKKDKIFVGDSAKVYSEKIPQDVVAGFKRKMGTTESFMIKCLGQSKTPTELSSYVLKELKLFVQNEKDVDAAVITIPASFDTVQSNATKEAGLQAGFKQVVLLQEPIAASLAYANKAKEKKLTDGQWMVYDLGGGTFDVALVKIQNGEMRILDHEGDNFLGGRDFDRLIVEKLVFPKLKENGSFNNLEQDMKSDNGKYNAKYASLINKAEAAKINLSSQTAADIEIDNIIDDNSKELDFSISIARSEFENLIKVQVDNTIEMIKKIMVKNSLTPVDLQFILMIGGSTFIPFVKNRVKELTQVEINSDIDPTTAIAIGAAYYAGTKAKNFETVELKKKTKVKVKMAYPKASNEKEEFFAARIEGSIEGLNYRITREDGGYDSGTKPLKEKIQEDLPLVEDAYNFFKLIIVDETNNIIKIDNDTIEIAQGKYSIAGQPIPHDICLEVDDTETGRTKLEMIFGKNSLLPNKKSISKRINRTIIKNSNENIRINVLEGPQSALPEANQSIGFISIKGTELERDIIKGSDIELKFEISESRDLTVSAYLTLSNQEFKKTYNPKERYVTVNMLKTDLEDLEKTVNMEISEVEEREEFETAKELKKVQREIEKIHIQAAILPEDSGTDEKFQIEDKKRKLAQELTNITKDKYIQKARAEYFDLKKNTQKLIEEHGNDSEQRHFNDLVQSESTVINSNSISRIKEINDQLYSLNSTILWRTPDFLIGLFNYVSKENYSRLNNQEMAKSLIEAGKFAIQSENWDRLSGINSELLNFLPKQMQNEITTKIGFN